MPRPYRKKLRAKAVKGIKQRNVYGGGPGGKRRVAMRGAAGRVIAGAAFIHGQRVGMAAALSRSPSRVAMSTFSRSSRAC